MRDVLDRHTRGTSPHGVLRRDLRVRSGGGHEADISLEGAKATVGLREESSRDRGLRLYPGPLSHECELTRVHDRKVGRGGLALREGLVPGYRAVVVTIADTVQTRRLLDGGAQVVEVLPKSAWREQHLPGAVSIPLPQMRKGALKGLDPDAPTVVYCYDHECDLSSRGAALLEHFGFSRVYDYSDSKTAWLGCGLQAEGDLRDGDRVSAKARRPLTCGPEATIGDVAEHLREPGTVVVVVVNEDDVVLGALHPHAAGLPASTSVLAAADPGPATVRPSMTRFELAKSMEKDQQDHILVATSGGELIGLVRRADLG
jgi:rhodanese-related sulfurtransferase